VNARRTDASIVALREAVPRVVAAVTRRFGDFAAAEDAVQDSLVAAYSAGSVGEAPTNASGWLYRVACRRMADRLSAERALKRREGVAAATRPRAEETVPPEEEEELLGDDETLQLMLMCCHPVLSPPSAIALTLRAVAGMTTAEIARGFLVSEATMAQRISRAKRAIAEAGASFAVPEASERAQRLSSVLQVLYLLFNEGYASASEDELVRAELSDEAIRLARILHRLEPEEPEVAGLLALFLLTDARRPARLGREGELIPLEEQDRTRWTREAITEGTALVSAALARGTVGAYQIQAAIAALHDQAPSVAATDWPQILALYGLLQQMTANPAVALSRVVAAAMVHGPRKALDWLGEVEADPRLAGGHRVLSVRAHLLERAGEPREAAAAYRAAAGAATNPAERRYLSAKATKLAPEPGTGAESGGPGSGS